MPDLAEREAENERRAARGWSPLRMGEAWDSRPRADWAESLLFESFTSIVGAFGHAPSLSEIVQYAECVEEVPAEDRRWWIRSMLEMSRALQSPREQPK